MNYLLWISYKGTRYAGFLFAIARVPGWCAHRVEEVEFANRIIRPLFNIALVARIRCRTSAPCRS